MKHIVIIIRYSILTSNLKMSWRIGRNNESFDDYKRNLFNSERMAFREKIFKKITLPSLDFIYNNTPNDVVFKVFLITSDELPIGNLNVLNDISKKYPFLSIITQSKDKVNISQPLDDYLSIVDKNEMYASVRLDDDDALSINWLNEIIGFLKPEYNDFVISLTTGFAAKVNENAEILDLANYKWMLASAGLTYIGINNKINTSIYQVGNHTKVDERKKTIIYSKGDFMMRSFSDFNDSVCNFPHKDGINILDADDRISAFGLNVEK